MIEDKGVILSVGQELRTTVLSLSDASLVYLRASKTFTTVMPCQIFEAAEMRRPTIVGVCGFAIARNTGTDRAR